MTLDPNQICVSGMKFSYTSRVNTRACLFEDFNVVIERGDFVWLTGRNGIGKTTLLKILAGILPVREGDVRIFGKRAGLAKAGFVFQDPSSSLLPWLSARRNIDLPSRWARTEPNARLYDATALLVPRLQLDFDLDRYPYELSGGQQQLVSVARALRYSPEILLLDEPFKELDIGYRLRLTEILRELSSDRQLSIVLAAHEVEAPLALANRVIVLDDHPVRVVIDERLESEDPRARACSVQSIRKSIEAHLKKRRPQIEVT